jgi:hypothetical protein
MQILTITFLAIIPKAAFAGVHFVSPSGTASWANATDSATPCSTGTAFANAGAEDTVYFRGGLYKVPAKNFSNTYHGYYEPVHSGTATHPIVFMACPNENPVFDGTAGGTGDKDGQGYYSFATIFGTNNKSYIVFDGFKFQADGSAKMARVMVGASYGDANGNGHIIVQNCIFEGGTTVIPVSTDNNEGLRIEAAVDVVVKNCTFSNYRQVNNWHNTSSIKTYHDSAVIVENCEFINNSLAIFFKSSTLNSTIRHNFIHNNSLGILVSPEIPPVMDMDNLMVYQNVIVNNSDFGFLHEG